MDSRGFLAQPHADEYFQASGTQVQTNLASLPSHRAAQTTRNNVHRPTLSITKDPFSYN